MDWFRYHTETLDNPKIQALPPQVFKRWVNFMCLQRIYEALPPVETIAFRLRCPERQAFLWREELVDYKLIDRMPDGSYRVHDWDEHQYKSDDSAGRKRRQRQRHAGRGTCDTSRDMSRDNVGTCPVVEQSRADTETEQSRISSTASQPITAADWPLSTGFVCEEFPTTDTSLMWKIIHASAQAAIGEGQTLTDEILLRALQEARRATPKQHNAVLYEKTAPTVIRNWAREAKRNGSKSV